VSDWKVHLEFVEGGSSKFWRARIDGGTLYVNFGRIGTAGQTQVKDLGSPDAAEREFDKLVREKRKKGYADAGSAGSPSADEGDEEDEDEEDEPRPKKKPAAAALPPAAAPLRMPARSAGAEFSLDARGRTVGARVSLDGTTVRLEADEAYDSVDAARAAFDRLRAALAADGYREKG
jgi:predicted DNA-binding WGR domain protein